MARFGIRYQLFILTFKVAVSTLVSLSVIYSIYCLIFTNDAELYDDIPSSHDWLLTFISGFFSAAVAMYFSWRFAKHIITPLKTVTDCAREVAEGNLSVRAQHSPREIREASSLIDDFNFMAEKLEVMSHEMKKWNAAIAHELRTPVTVLQGRIQGMAEGIFEKDPQQFELLLKQTAGLSRLIDDLRVLSLSDSGQLYLYRETLHIKDVLLSVVNSFREQLKQSGLEPVIESEDILCFVDDVRIRQVVAALLSNASKYAVAGVLMITCRSADNHVILTVEDEGPGISEADREAVFDAFYRAETDQMQRPDSSGLGLAVVSAIAQAHGGSARCLSSRLGGTCMQVTLLGNPEA